MSATKASRSKLEIREYDEQRWEEFFGKHGRKAYTPTFNTALEGLLSDRGADVDERVYAAVVLMSWGNHSDHAIYATGDIFGQSAISRLLELPKQRVTEAVNAQKSRFRLRTEGRAIYPVDDPQSERLRLLDAQSPGSPDNRQTKGEEYSRFHSSWISENAERHRQREEARAIVDDINQEELKAYKAWRKSQTPRTKRSEQPSRTPRTEDLNGHKLHGQPVTNSADNKSGTGVTNNGPILIEKKQSIKGMHAGQIHRLNALREFFDETITDQSLDRLDDYLKNQLGQDYEFAHLINLVAQRRRKGRIGAGLLLNLEKGIPHDFCELSRRRSPSPELQDLPQEVEKLSPAQEIERLTELIEHFPDHANVSTWREEITELQSRQAATGGSS